MQPNKLRETVYPQRGATLEVHGRVEVPRPGTVLATAGEVRQMLALGCGGQLVAMVEMGAAAEPEEREHVFIIDRGEAAQPAGLEDFEDREKRKHFVRKRYVVLDERAVGLLRTARNEHDFYPDLPFATLNPGESMLVGRNVQVDSMGVRDRSDVVSRQHVEISIEPDGAVMVTDLDSTNGTNLLVPESY